MEVSSETSRLGENLLGEALNGHKIRHIEEKVEALDKDDQLVLAILERFCTPPTTTTTTTTTSTTTTEDEKSTVEVAGEQGHFHHEAPPIQSHERYVFQSLYGSG